MRSVGLPRQTQSQGFDQIKGGPQGLDNCLARSIPHLLAHEAQGLLLFLLIGALEGDKIIATFGNYPRT